MFYFRQVWNLCWRKITGLRGTSFHVGKVMKNKERMSLVCLLIFQPVLLCQQSHIFDFALCFVTILSFSAFPFHYYCLVSLNIKVSDYGFKIVFQANEMFIFRWRYICESLCSQKSSVSGYKLNYFFLIILNVRNSSSRSISNYLHFLAFYILLVQNIFFGKWGFRHSCYEIECSRSCFLFMGKFFMIRIHPEKSFLLRWKLALFCMQKKKGFW